MATTSASPTTSALSTRLVAGVAGGLAGGIVFGALMQMMGMMPMIAMLVGSGSPAVGWLVHLAISAFIGSTYALLFAPLAGRLPTGAAAGAVYGLVWWGLGPLLIMPTLMGMPVLRINTMTGQSLMGHLVYGLVLGVAYALLLPRLRRV